MNIRTIAESAITWFQAYRECGKTETEAESMAAQQMVERYPFDLVPQLDTTFRPHQKGNGLTLRRKPGRSIVITTPGGERIVLTVLAVHNNGSVELNFRAPVSVQIDREEVSARKAS